MRIIAVCLMGFCLAAMAEEPPISPGEADWRFVDALAAPMVWHPHWTRTTKADNEVSLKDGVQVVSGFPDADGVLETAYNDLNRFFAAASLPAGGPFRIVTERVPTPKPETFRMAVSEGECRIQANDSEGIRRGIYYLEDDLMRADGPFLAIGETQRSPFVHTRISRCFFGPIKRPPMNRDELLDDVDYYPDGYLNRLAHDGVNGLWLTIEFKDFCKTSLMAESGPDRDRRLEKLRKTVAKCRRYGIKIFLFCIEPAAMTPGNPLLIAHPELGGATLGDSSRLFCPFSDAAQTYLREALHDVFSQVPGLGGLINISYGESPTTCLSGADADWHINCPTCSGKQPWEVLSAALSAMERGMHEAAPDAKLISWLYVPESGPGTTLPTVEPLNEIARHTPPGVIVQYNFESGGRKLQLGKERLTSDYWLSYVGPSDAFKGIASAVSAAGGAEMGAKIQVCCSHEVASAPYVPVPSQLYRKYREMRALGVTSVMQCWYFGNMPSIMNRAAASELPFAADGVSEDEFLLNLARRDWGLVNAPQVVQAWRLFAEAYDNYPVTNPFQFYGPVADGVVWPLHLKPAHRVLGPTWRLDYPISGDRIGECFSGTHTYPEVLELCRNMSEIWKRGLDILGALKTDYALEPERLMDISNAEALGIQFRSGYNILRFYDLREQLLYGPVESKSAILRELRSVVDDEIKNSTDMAALCEGNAFLGFHAEAEGYKYFPAKLQWRVNLLRELLDTEFVVAERAVAAGEDVFPSLSGKADAPLVYQCRPAPETFASGWRTDAAWLALSRDPNVVKSPLTPNDPATSWQAAHDGEALYLNIECAMSEPARPLSAALHIQSSHIYPRRTFQLDENGKRNVQLAWRSPGKKWESEASTSDGRRTFRFCIPFDEFDGEFDPSRPMCINVKVQSTVPNGATPLAQTWAPLSPVPPMNRIGYGTEDPKEMGWLRLEQ
ncbi:MAG: hypothetical protein WC655_04180 [Candidatus Hydrogenedentales bacterium]